LEDFFGLFLNDFRSCCRADFSCDDFRDFCFFSANAVDINNPTTTATTINRPTGVQPFPDITSPLLPVESNRTDTPLTTSAGFPPSRKK
jgi:hypothetical protein